jgi:hypothetical protein
MEYTESKPKVSLPHFKPQAFPVFFSNGHPLRIVRRSSMGSSAKLLDHPQPKEHIVQL